MAAVIPSTSAELTPLSMTKERGGDHLSYLKAAISLNYDTTSALIELTDPIAWDKGQEEP
jgi:hypothetical protein